MDISFFLEKLSNLVLQEAALFGEVEGQVRLLKNEVEWMRLVLEDADGRQNQDKRQKIWVNQIREAAYDAEDVIDDFMFKVEHQRQQRLDHLKLLRFLPTCVSFADKLSFVHELDARVKDINATIEKILANKSRYKIQSPSLSDATASSMAVVVRREKGHRMDEEIIDIVGRERDAKDVEGMLDVHGEKRRKVVAIVGMGGLGKTALSEKVFCQVKQQFDCAALVSVSHQCRVRELFISIANSVMVDLSTAEQRGEMADMAENQLARKVYGYLKDKRYLIVLDDLWSTEVWDQLNSYFPESNGSRVLITTRDEGIASHAYSEIHRLHILDDIDSWKLFVKRSFQVERSTESFECPKELKDLGTRITEKCKGLPLAIVAVGDLLSSKAKTEDFWSKILHKMEWLLSEGPGSCYKILSLSYINNFPHSLKYCFLYFGTFPKDSEIEAKKLIQLWISEGLVLPRGTEETLEEVAEDNLQQLILRSMIQVGKKRSDGKVKSCRIHDILHDLAISIARDTNFFEVSRNSNFVSPVGVRRLIVHDYHRNTAQHLQSLRLQSIICSLHIHAESLKSFVGAKLLTVLDLTITGHHRMKQLPKEVGQLIHLKYFSLKGATVVELPWSIGRLVNLRILDFQTSIILSIPCSIWKLRQLKYLHCGYSWISNQSILQRSLRGHLGVDQLTNLRTLHLRPEGWLESCSLEKLTQLIELKLYEGVVKSSYNLCSPSLVKLKLEYCKLEQDPMLTLGKLPNLTVLKLIVCDSFGRKMTCSSETFPRLQSLRLVALPELEELQVEDGAMPVLKTLQIAECPKMKKLPHGLLHLKNLQELELKQMASDLIEESRTTDEEELDNIRLITKLDGNYLVRPQEADGSSDLHDVDI